MAQIIDESFGYNLFQELYCLNFATNAAGKTHGTVSQLQAGLQNALKQHLPKLDSAWDVTFGPVVYKKNFNLLTGPDNAWYVAVNTDKKLCVVAVAGTAAFSASGWMGDIDVTQIVDFESWTQKWTTSGVPPVVSASYEATKSMCAHGTCVFVSNIMNTPSPANAACPNTRLGQYLQDFRAKNPAYKIIVTGHSLGGAVSPALALGLVQSNVLKNDSNVYTLPSAGPSPGNATFSSSFESIFPATRDPELEGDYCVYNTDFYNALDIVPQAWSVDRSKDRNLYQITTSIFSNVGDGMKRHIQDLVNRAMKRPGMPYVPLPGTKFEGSDIPSDMKVLTLLGVILRENVDDYAAHIGVSDFVRLFRKTLRSQPGVEEIPVDEELSKAVFDTSEADADTS